MGPAPGVVAFQGFHGKNFQHGTASDTGLLSGSVFRLDRGIEALRDVEGKVSVKVWFRTMGTALDLWRLEVGAIWVSAELV